MDNSGTTDFTTRVLMPILQEIGAEDYVILRDPWLNSKDERRDHLSQHMAEMSNRMLLAAADVNWILTLETDILVEAEGAENIIPNWMRTMQENLTVAMIGAVVPSRWHAPRPDGGTISVYRVPTVDPWSTSRGHLPLPQHGLVEVHAYGTNMVLMRPGLVQHVGFAATPNIDGSGGQGHEWFLQKTMLISGYKILADWDVRPRHYLTADMYYQA
jgi:hypothetical protein